MVELEQLRYVRLKPNDIGHAADFAVRVLGLEPIDRTPDVATFRSDFRDHTLAFEKDRHSVQVGRARSPLFERSRRVAEGLEPARAFGRPRLRRRLRAAQGQGHGLVHRLQRQSDRAGGAAAELRMALFPEPRRRHPWTLRRVLIRSTEHRKGPVDLDRRLRRRGSATGPATPPISRFDDAHHRIALFPADRPGILAVEYAVEDVNLLMRNHYVLRDLQVAGRARAGTPSRLRPVVSDLRRPRRRPLQLRRGRRAAIGPAHRPRQFPAGPDRPVRMGKRMQESKRVQRRLERAKHVMARACGRLH